MFPNIETSQLICRASQLTGFYMMGTLVVKGLILDLPAVTWRTAYRLHGQYYNAKQKQKLY